MKNNFKYNGKQLHPKQQQKEEEEEKIKLHIHLLLTSLGLPTANKPSQAKPSQVNGK